MIQNHVTSVELDYLPYENVFGYNPTLDFLGSTTAFLASELGEILKQGEFDIWYSYPDWRLKLPDSKSSDVRDESLPNAMAEMLSYLIINKLIEI